MNMPVGALPLSTADVIAAKKKRVLLLDTSQTKRDLRADVVEHQRLDGFRIGGFHQHRHRAAHRGADPMHFF